MFVLTRLWTLTTVLLLLWPAQTQAQYRIQRFVHSGHCFCCSTCCEICAGSQRTESSPFGYLFISFKIVRTVWTVRTTHAGLGFALSQVFIVLGTVRTVTPNRFPPMVAPSTGAYGRTYPALRPEGEAYRSKVFYPRKPLAHACECHQKPF